MLVIRRLLSDETDLRREVPYIEGLAFTFQDPRRYQWILVMGLIKIECDCFGFITDQLPHVAAPFG